MKLKRDRTKGTRHLQQEDYINSILSQFKMADCSGKGTPMEATLRLTKTLPGKPVKVPYRELVGQLLYLSVTTRPDIAFVTSFLSQYNNKYTDTHWGLAKRVLRYLKATATLGIKYTKHPEPSVPYRKKWPQNGYSVAIPDPPWNLASTNL
ncbi:hypothetical protein FOCC_FOCC015111 [Frankliniella occidentalis]|nr:hypothetical protein FOCC_FOCC015111 [Frankliniella occidentalis]